MLAYVLCHRPRRGADAGEYEEAQRLEELPFDAGTAQSGPVPELCVGAGGSARSRI